MKRFLLFTGDDFYPLGGWKDFKGDFNTESEAIHHLIDFSNSYDWWHIIDTQDEMKIIQSNLNVISS